MANENKFPEYDKYLDGDEKVTVKRSKSNKDDKPKSVAPNKELSAKTGVKKQQSNASKQPVKSAASKNGNSSKQAVKQPTKGTADKSGASTKQPAKQPVNSAASKNGNSSKQAVKQPTKSTASKSSVSSKQQSKQSEKLETSKDKESPKEFIDISSNSKKSSDKPMEDIFSKSPNQPLEEENGSNKGKKPLEKPIEDISSKSNKSDKKLKIGLGILCGVTGVFEVVAVVMLAMIGILPTAFLVLAGVAFALLLFIICTLMFMKSKHKFGKRKIAATILAVITIISCAIGIFFMGKIYGVFGAVTKDGKKITKDQLDDPFVLYISGSDTRNKSLDLESRSDTNILAIVNPQTNKVLLVNTPRDSYVPNPHLDNAKDKLTHCGIYGIDNSMAALSNLYGVDIDYYCKINFTGVITLIDAIGGVDIYSDVAFTTEATSNVHINAGDNHLDGEEALAFARERYALAGGDFSRGENQMKLIKAVADKLMDSSNLLKNASSVMNSLEGMFTTDCPQLLITSLIKGQLSGEASRFEISSFAVSGGTGMASCASDRSQPLSVVYLDDSSVEEAKAQIAAALAGEDPLVDTSTETN